MTNNLTSKYILIVDDDATMQMLLQSMISKTGFEPIIAETGKQAIEYIKKYDYEIGLILLDRHLPDMDGLEIVKNTCTFIPIIMQSGSNSAKDIREAIEAGVFHYLTKPFSKETLQSTLSLVLSQTELREILKEHIESGHTPENLLQSASFVLKTMEDAQSLSIHLASLFPDPYRVFLGILALLTNAVEHGSCGIGFDEKTKLISDGKYYDKLSKLSPKNTIEVQFIKKDNRISIRITDTGKGFNWKDWIDFKQERESFTHGYGIQKAINSFDELKYNTAGNQVMATVLEK